MKKFISALLILTMLVSMVCVSTSAAGIHVNMNFDSMEVFTAQFVAGAFYVDGGGILYGYAEAKALQTQYDEDDNGIFVPNSTSWLTYDATITLTVADDDLSESNRHINLVYCNDNLAYEGVVEDRIMMSFGYDIQERCFRLTSGYCSSNVEDQYMDPVYREIATDGEEAITLGISVAKDNIRCFYNDELIFDFKNTDMMIAHQIVSPFLFWQEGNYIEASNITVADQGYLFPNGIVTPPAESSGTTDPDESSSNTDNTAAPDDTDPTPVDSDNPDDNEGNAPSDSADNNEADANKPDNTTTKQVAVDVTDDKGQVVTDDKGEKVTSMSVVTDPAPAETNNKKPQGGNATATGDATFVVIAAMVATLGCALVIKKVTVK